MSTQYWMMFGSGWSILLLWVFVTGFSCSAFGKDYWTPQARWFTETITAPARWAAAILTSPGIFIREYWAHQEKMLELKRTSEMESRLGVLENIAIDDKGDA